MKKIKTLVSSIATILGVFLAACSSDSGTGSDAVETSEVKTVYGLGDCKGSNEGVTKLVTSENRYYTCADGQWSVSGAYIDTVKTDDDLPACLSKNEGDSAFVLSEMSVFRCQSSKWKNSGFVMGWYETKSKLPACEEKFDGLKGFVKNDSAVYVCDGEAWEAWADVYASEDDLPNCSSRREGSLAWLLNRSLALVCEDGSWDNYVEQAPKSSSSRNSQGVSFSSAGNSRQSSDKNGSIYDVSASTLTDLRDGKIYRTVQIGNQVWMAENLDYYTTGSYCNNCAIYGRLYTWELAKKVCPTGWHLPSEVEFETLINAVGGEKVAGKKLKSTSGWKWDEYGDYDGNGDDAFGFSALPAGIRDDDRYDDFDGTNTAFWSSTEVTYDNPCYMLLNYRVDNADLLFTASYFGFSVRCLKDEGSSSTSNKNDTESSSSSESSSSNKDNTGSSSSSVSSSSNKNNTDSSSSSLSSSSSKNNTGLSSSNVSSSSSKDNTSSSSSSVSSSSSKNNTGASSSSVDHCKGVTYDESTEICDSRDGQVYRTTTINIPSKSYSEVWMAENLNFDTTGSACSNCAIYGRLYTWELAKKVCPTGWHLPSEVEFETLIDAVGGEDVAGEILKSTSGWVDNGNGSDNYGFSALPAGSRGNMYFIEDYETCFWSSTEFSGSDAYLMFLGFYTDGADLFADEKTYGYSVRCIKD